MIKPLYLFLLAGGHGVLAVFAVVSELTSFSFKLEGEMVSRKSPVLESSLLWSTCLTTVLFAFLAGGPLSAKGSMWSTSAGRHLSEMVAWV